MAEFNVGETWGCDTCSVRILELNPAGEISYEFLIVGRRGEDRCTVDDLRAWVRRQDAQLVVKQTCTKRRLAHVQV